MSPHARQKNATAEKSGWLRARATQTFSFLGTCPASSAAVAGAKPPSHTLEHQKVQSIRCPRRTPHKQQWMSSILRQTIVTFPKGNAVRAGKPTAPLRLIPANCFFFFFLFRCPRRHRKRGPTLHSSARPTPTLCPACGGRFRAIRRQEVS